LVKLTVKLAYKLVIQTLFSEEKQHRLLNSEVRIAKTVLAV